jgi:hypothetical protein
MRGFLEKMTTDEEKIIKKALNPKEKCTKQKIILDANRKQLN